jgi:hypothetical protein
MKDAKNVLRVVGMILLGLFVFMVGVPLIATLAGVTLGIIGSLIGLAVLLIKIAVVLAILYLILVGCSCPAPIVTLPENEVGDSDLPLQPIQTIQFS